MIIFLWSFFITTKQTVTDLSSMRIKFVVIFCLVPSFLVLRSLILTEHNKYYMENSIV